MKLSTSLLAHAGHLEHDWPAILTHPLSLSLLILVGVVAIAFLLQRVARTRRLARVARASLIPLLAAAVRVAIGE